MLTQLQANSGESEANLIDPQGVEADRLRQNETKIKELEGRLQKYESEKFNIIEVLTIVVAFFTFISTEFQIFKESGLFSALGFSLILLGGLSFLILVLRFAINKEIDLRTTVLVLVSAGLIGYGTYTIRQDTYKGNGAYYTKVDSDKKYDELSNKLQKYLECVSRGGGVNFCGSLTK